MKPVFLMDIDGVAADIVKAVCNRVNRDYGTEFVLGDVDKWNFDFGPVTFTEVTRKYLRDEEFVLGIEVYPGFKEFLDGLRKRCDVIFATSRPKSELTIRWLIENFGEVSCKFGWKKHKMGGMYILDDYLPMVIKCAKSGMTSFLMVRKYNESFIKEVQRVGVTAIRRYRDVLAERLYF